MFAAAIETTDVKKSVQIIIKKFKNVKT